MDNNKTLTLGSLFDGSGGFPLAGMLAGIKPIWASEILPFPTLVTHKRLPDVKHYGDVSKLSGATLEPVDIITFGSPCQDMSIAGKRAGLDGERSGLFHQAIRIIKEMREATNGEKPRYIVWENVPGCQSSNNGDDFRAVLEEICQIKNSEISIPKPEGKWTNAGEIMGDDFSVAWRILDAQHWGVAQRRARVYLVADFDGQSAGEILFESEGLSRYSQSCGFPWQRTSGSAEESIGKTGWCLNPQGSSGLTITEEQTGTLVAQDHGNHPAVLESAGFCTEHSATSRSVGYEEENSPTLRAGVIPAAIVLDNHPADSRVTIAKDGKVQTLTKRIGTGGGNTPMIAEPLRSEGFDRYNGKVTVDVAHTLDTGASDTVPMVFQEVPKSYGISKEAFNGGKNANFNFAIN